MLHGINKKYGLLQCTFRDDEDSDILSFCWLKLCEMTISGILVAICLHELYRQVQAYGWKFEWRFFALIFMISSLLVNMAFCLWNSVYTLYSLQSFFYSMYFLVVVAYVIRMYMRKNGWASNPRNNHFFIVFVVLVGLLYTAILVDSIVKEDSQMVNKSCEQIWYLAINVSCLGLCLIALFVLYCSQKEERQRLLRISYENNQVRSPFMELWCWIGLNTFAQFVNLIQTGLLIGTDQTGGCMIVRNNSVGDNVLKFFFAITTLTTGYVATLYYFKHVRNSTGYVEQVPVDPSFDRSEGPRGSYGLQMYQGNLEDIS